MYQETNKSKGNETEHIMSHLEQFCYGEIREGIEGYLQSSNFRTGF